jgi:hypothetical protein
VGYPFEYRGQVFTLGKLTLRVREAYVDWLRSRMVQGAVAFLEADAVEDYLKQAIEPDAVYWAVDASEPVRESFLTEEGTLRIARLLLGGQVKVWTDAQLSELIESEGYALALKLCLADSIPTSEEGQSYCAGPKAMPRIVSTLCGDPFWQPVDAVRSLTLRHVWEWFIGPAVEKQRDKPPPSAFGGHHTPNGSPPRKGQQTQRFSSEDESGAELLYGMCGKRVHKGPRWWLGEDPAVKLYDGKGN